MATYNIDDFEAFQQNMQTNEESRSESEGTTVIKGTSPNSNNLDSLIQHISKKDMLLEKLVDKLIVNTTPISTSSSSATPIMLNLFQKIPEFDGEPNKAKLWLNDLDSARIVHSLPDNYIFETGRTRLVGGAKYCYEMKRSEINTWDDLCRNLHKHL